MRFNLQHCLSVFGWNEKLPVGNQNHDYSVASALCQELYVSKELRPGAGKLNAGSPGPELAALF